MGTILMTCKQKYEYALMRWYDVFKIGLNKEKALQKQLNEQIVFNNHLIDLLYDKEQSNA